MNSKHKTYSIHLLVIFISLCLPMFYSFIKYQSKTDEADVNYNKPNLIGLVISDEKPKYSLVNWMDGSYQKLSEDYNNDHWAYKEILVRLNNQFYYKAFNQIRVNGFVIGKDNYVFSESYIFSAFGDDLIKEEKVITQLQKAKLVQDSLKKKGIDLLLVYAPGKGSFCKEFIEDK